MVTDSQYTPGTWVEVRERARMNGLELSEADVHDLLPYHVQHRRWLQTLRRVLEEGNEPATAFSAVDPRNVRE